MYQIRKVEKIIFRRFFFNKESLLTVSIRRMCSSCSLDFYLTGLKIAGFYLHLGRLEKRHLKSKKYENNQSSCGNYN